MHFVPRVTRQWSVRTRTLLVAAVATLVVTGCEAATALKAQFENLEGNVNVWAMNGSPLTLPSSITLNDITPRRIDATFLFDLAFDMDSLNRVQVYTLSRVANELVGTHRVGIQLSSSPFASLTKAPGGGYVFDTVMALPIGKTMLVQVLEQNCATSIIGTTLYAKLSVDSTNTTTRAIYLHVLSDPNCGYRGLETGIPKS